MGIFMITIQNDNFSLSQICQSGQCFRMTQEEATEGIVDCGRYHLVAFGKYLEIFQERDRISFACTQEEWNTIWRYYFDLDTDYAAIIQNIDVQDTYLSSAAAYGNGIRVLKQDLWEILISFIISQQNNIKRIRKCIRTLCETYGEQKKTQTGILYYAFPTPQALAGAAIEDLYACNLGYRSRYIHQTAESILNGEVDLAALSAMDYTAAKTELMKLCGVGVKVADCVCLYALHKTDAFPIDTHIKQVLAAQYPKGFPFDRYAGYSGILQQYIFYFDLTH